MILPTFQLVANVVKQMCVAQRQAQHSGGGTGPSSSRLSKYNARLASAIELLCANTLVKPLPLAILSTSCATKPAASSASTTTTKTKATTNTASSTIPHQRQPPPTPRRNVCLCVSHPIVHETNMFVISHSSMCA